MAGKVLLAPHQLQVLFNSHYDVDGGGGRGGPVPNGVKIEIRSLWSNQKGPLKYHATAELTCSFLVSNTSAAVFCCVYRTPDGAIACCCSKFTTPDCTSWDTCGCL